MLTTFKSMFCFMLRPAKKTEMLWNQTRFISTMTMGRLWNCDWVTCSKSRNGHNVSKCNILIMSGQHTAILKITLRTQRFPSVADGAAHGSC
jgi:hypothetical protein